MRHKFISLWLAVGLVLAPALLSAEGLEPSASFTISSSVGTATTEFQFDASDSRDHRGLTNGLDYRWNFNYTSGGQYTDWDNDSTVTHVYNTSDPSPERKTIALEVRDADGLVDRVFNTLTVQQSLGFDSWFTVSPLSGDTNEQFEFEASVSTPGGQNTDSYQFRWDFNGDGTWDTSYSTSRTVSHVYPSTGYYTPRLQVKNPSGDTQTLIGYDQDNLGDPSFVYVTFSGTPQASFMVSPTSGVAGGLFHFDGSNSFDRQDGRDLSYRWDFNGDGVFEIDWGTENTHTFSYDGPGEFDPMLQVRDTDGNTDEVTVRVSVTADDLAPEASFSISSDRGLGGDALIGTTSTQFTFNASGSQDEETSSIDLQVRWDFDGDEEWDTDFDTQKSAEHRYLDVGAYIIILEVRDSENRRDTAERTVTVVANDAPVPVLKVDITQGTPGSLFHFDASDSSDSQYSTSQLEARWDWEGDGTWDTPFERDKTVSHQYEQAGSYSAKLQIRDPEGSMSMAAQSIEIVASTAPSARLTVDETSGTFSTIFHLDASASSDGETAQSDLWFRWDFDYKGGNDIQYDTSWSRSKTRNTRFTQTGENVVRVEVKDEDGDISSATVTTSLHWASSYMETLKTRGIIRGYSGGDLAPDRQVTRAELLKMVMEAAGVKEFRTTYDDYFFDVERTDWFVQYVETAYEQGIAGGYSDGNFRPNDSINRAEAMKLILQGFDVSLSTYKGGTFPDVTGNAWFSSYIGTAHELGLINGYSDGQFRPGNLMTRGEASKVIALALEGAL
jgi:hypothetical protein